MSNFYGSGFSAAWQLIITHDPLLWGAIDVTVEVAAVSTAIATVLGLPLGVLLGLGRFPGRRILLSIANAGLGLPSVLVGIVLVLLFLPTGALGRLGIIFTLKAVIVGQTVLAFPVVVALSASAVDSITPGLLDQARAFDAPRYRVGLLALREARIGVLASIVAAAGTALSEVAAAVLLGGNIERFDQTLGGLALEQVSAGRYEYGFAAGIVLFALVLAVSAVLTVLQYVNGRPLRRRRRL